MSQNFILLFFQPFTMYTSFLVHGSCKISWWAGFGPWVIAKTGLIHLRKDTQTLITVTTSKEEAGGGAEMGQEESFTEYYSVSFEYCNLCMLKTVNYYWAPHLSFPTSINVNTNHPSQTARSTLILTLPPQLLTPTVISAQKPLVQWTKVPH